MLIRLLLVLQPQQTTTVSLTSTTTSFLTVVQSEGSDDSAVTPAPYNSFSAPGDYFIPASRLTLTVTAVVPCPTATSLETYPPGTYTRPETTLAVSETNTVYVCPFTTTQAVASSDTPEVVQPTGEPPFAVVSPPAEDLHENPAADSDSEVVDVVPIPEDEPVDVPAPVEAPVDDAPIPEDDATVVPTDSLEVPVEYEVPVSADESVNVPAATPEAKVNNEVDVPGDDTPEVPAPTPEEPAHEVTPVPAEDNSDVPAPVPEPSPEEVHPATGDNSYDVPSDASPDVEEPQVEEPQVEEPQVEEPQVEEPQVEEPQVEEPEAEGQEDEDDVVEPSQTSTFVEPSAATAEPSETPSDDQPGSSKITSNGQKWGMTYTPYTGEGGECKDADSVMSDLETIKAAGFTTVRLYGTDCSGLENVGKACEAHGLRLIIGIFIEETGIEGARSQVDDILEWGAWDLVDMVVIGNEAIFGQRADADSLAAFILEAKEEFRAAGYDGPCTTTEPSNVWIESGSALCDAIDVMGANVHPFFNSKVSPEKAGEFTAEQMELIGEVCPGKDVYNLESGWPKAGQANGDAIPGQDAQATALSGIMDEVGDRTVFFSFEDDLWKDAGEFGVEQSWGCSEVFGQ